MFKVVGIMFLGMALGYAFRGPVQRLPLSRIVMLLIWLLLFLLGVEVGSDPRILEGLFSLGVEALLLSLAGVAGSVLAAWALWRYVVRHPRKEVHHEG